MQQSFENLAFHEYDRRLGLLLSRINSVKYGEGKYLHQRRRPEPFNLTKANLTLIEKYYIDLVNEALTKPRILSVLDQTCRLLVWLNKDWLECTVDDIKQVVNQVRNKDNFSEHTKSDYLEKLKRFDKWFNNGDCSEKTRKLKTTMKARLLKLPNQLITPQEAELLINATTSARDKAIVHVLWETGARIGEIANLKFADLEFNNGECNANLYGKTGSRRVLLVESVKDLQNYLKLNNTKTPNCFPVTFTVTSTFLLSFLQSIYAPSR